MLKQPVKRDLRIRIALQLHYDAHAVSVRFIADIGNMLDLFFLDQLCDLFDNSRFIDLIRDLCKHDLHFSL